MATIKIDNKEYDLDTLSDECKAQLAIERVFEPLWSRDQAESKLAQWQAAVGVPNAG